MYIHPTLMKQYAGKTITLNVGTTQLQGQLEYLGAGAFVCVVDNAVEGAFLFVRDSVDTFEETVRDDGFLYTVTLKARAILHYQTPMLPADYAMKFLAAIGTFNRGFINNEELRNEITLTIYQKILPNMMDGDIFPLVANGKQISMRPASFDGEDYIKFLLSQPDE